MIGLTAKQAEALRFITTYMAQHDGEAPSLQEMQDALGYTSKSPVFYLLCQLEQRGRIRRLKNRARALEVLTPAEPEPQVIYIPPPPPEPIVQRIRAAGDDEFRVIVKTVSDELLRRRAAA